MKYDRFSVLFVNAFKEQQTQIEQQQRQITNQLTQIERLEKQLDLLKKLVCITNPTADVCQK